MTYFLRNPHPVDQSWHFTLDNIFTEDQISFIMKKAEQTENSQQPKDEIRQNEATWLEPSEEMSEIYQVVSNAFRYANDTKFQFAIDFVERLQHLSYDCDHFFDWHVDTEIKYADHQPIRKISASILLNDEYEGGEFKFASNQLSFEVGKIKRNSAVFFPSFMPHTVTPITKGNRQSLIAWARGPQFV